MTATLLKVPQPHVSSAATLATHRYKPLKEILSYWKTTTGTCVNKEMFTSITFNIFFFFHYFSKKKSQSQIIVLLVLHVTCKKKNNHSSLTETFIDTFLIG